jgi:predicted phosphodiesterase
MHKFKIQYISDIHSEYQIFSKYLPFNLEPKTNFLALCGDIGNPFHKNYEVIIKQVSTNFDKVFLLSGNHEYIHSVNRLYNIEDTNNEINTICNKYNNVYFMNNRSIDFSLGDNNNYKIHGTTLWSKTNSYYNYNNMNSNLHNSLHNMSVKYLEENIDPHKKNIVLTHYMPSYSLIADKYKNDASFSNKLERYATNLDHMFKEHILCWLCGHSHHLKITKINNVYCGLNPYLTDNFSEHKTGRVIIFEE